MNCVRPFFEQANIQKDKPAIILFDSIKAVGSNKEISFKQLKKSTLQAQKFLKNKSLKRGDTILFFEMPSAELYAFILAVLASGIKVLIVEPWLRLNQIEEIIQDIKPKAFMTGRIGKAWGLFHKSIRKIPFWFNSKELHNITVKPSDEIFIEEMESNDLAILTFTSGTSGKSKGVARTHKLLINQTEVLAKYLDYGENQGMDLTIFTNLVLANLGQGKGSIIIPHNWSTKALRELSSLPQNLMPDTLACGPAFLKHLMSVNIINSLRSFHIGGALADNSIYEVAFANWPNAHFHHVYGSTEAEPVAVTDLRTAVSLSKEKGYFQTLYLGRKISEVKTQNRNGSYWVAGPHVSKLYLNNIEENLKVKYQDETGEIWHNMGDRIVEDENGLWYKGRDFQQLEDFELEQSVYSQLNHSKCIVHRSNGKIYICGENLPSKNLEHSIKGVDEWISSKVYRDKRHRARLDRKKMIKKVKAL